MYWIYVGEVVAASVLECVLGSILSVAVVCAKVATVKAVVCRWSIVIVKENSNWLKIVVG
jgi:hypothetical protein